jgi:hypothetical protein
VERTAENDDRFIFSDMGVAYGDLPFAVAKNSPDENLPLKIMI